LHSVPVHRHTEVEPAFAAIKKQGSPVLIVPLSSMLVPGWTAGDLGREASVVEWLRRGGALHQEGGPNEQIPSGTPRRASVPLTVRGTVRARVA
jgi:hypothetical protein